MTGIFYPPETHSFEHVALAPWPQFSELQLDWVSQMTELERWLDQYIGAHTIEWAYAEQPDHDYWSVAIAFKRAQSKTLFLLKWA